MSRLADLMRQRSDLEAQLETVQRKIDTLNRPKTPRNVKERIAVWRDALKILDEAADERPGSRARVATIKRAFKHVLVNLGGKPLVLRRSLATWAKAFIEDEKKAPPGHDVVASTRRKFAHLSVADVREFKMLQMGERDSRGAPPTARNPGNE